MKFKRKMKRKKIDSSMETRERIKKTTRKYEEEYKNRNGNIEVKK